MKNILLRSLLPGLAAAAFAFAPTAQAIDKVSIEVQVHSENVAPATEAKPAKGPKLEHDESKTLEIKVTNTMREELKDLKVKWTLFGDDLKDNSTAITESGDESASLAPNTSQTVKSKTATYKGERAHSETSGGGGKGKKATAKRVPASGTRYAGWAVQVMQGNTLVGEAYSRPELKASLK